MCVFECTTAGGLSAELVAAAAAASYWENERADWGEKAMTRPNGAEIDRIGIG